MYYVKTFIAACLLLLSSFSFATVPEDELKLLPKEEAVIFCNEMFTLAMTADAFKTNGVPLSDVLDAIYTQLPLEAANVQSDITQAVYAGITPREVYQVCWFVARGGSQPL